MLGFGMGEIMIIAVVVLIVVGPDKLPQFARSAGRLYGQVRRTADEMRRSLVLEADRQDADARYEKMRERRAKVEAERAAAEAANPGVAHQEEHLPGTDHLTDADPDAVSDTEDPPFDHGDSDLRALMDDPHGPYASGRSIDDVMDAHATPQPAQSEPAPSDGAATMTGSPLPAGVTPEEWAELPQHIRQLLSEKSGDLG